MPACLLRIAFCQKPLSPPTDPLSIEPVKTSITVSGTLSTEAPASIEIVDRKSIEQAPGISLDDRLRNVPGFTLFRRSSGLVANPTTQGVSLRGLGSSGASRSLILWDAIPLNDPFGGWVYWTRLAPDDIERAEVVRGGSTSIFGDRALAGSIGVFSRAPERWHLRLSEESGNRGTNEVGAAFSNVFRVLNQDFGISARTRFFETDGYFIVPATIRGAVDTEAGVRFATGALTLDWIGNHQRFSTKLDVLAEDRANGTVLQRNSTSLGTLSAQYSRDWTKDGITVVGYRTQEEFHASFSSLAASRNTETATSLQQVPSDSTGAAAYWRHSESIFTALAGADVERVEGYSNERLFPAGFRSGGGIRLTHGAFGQIQIKTGRWSWFGGLRNTFTGDDNFWSPSGGFAVGLGRVRLRGSVYRSFRAPSLNELYRYFRAGNAETLANPLLVPEKLFGAEAGMDWIGEKRSLHVTAFRNSLDDLISNITLRSTPQLITRQRANSQAALARGAEVSLRERWGNHWNGELQHMFVDSRYANGARLPQVARNQGSFQLSFQRKGTLLAAGIRSYSSQFEDDLNSPGQRMGGFASVQLQAKQKLWASIYATVAIENLLDRQYVTGFTPTPQIGPPRLWRAGLRWDGAVR